jgi:hypothetical protein
LATKARLYDNTRLSDYKRCPRLFFFRHVLSWVPKGTRLPLVFGAGWHSALEVVWANIGRMDKRENLAKAAFAAFLKDWTEAGLPYPLTYEQEKELSPRTPMKAYDMIVAYISDRQERFRDFEIVAIEQPFIVPLDPNDPTLFYVGKIDKIVKYQGKTLGIEHKTTTAYAKNGGFRSLFLESFSPNSQVDGYQYALHMLYPGGAGGVWVDAALVHKENEAFQFIPVEKQLKYLDSWLWDTQMWIQAVEEQKRRAAFCIPEDSYLAAFPKNTNSCWDFNSACAYHDICKAWSNPLGRPMPDEYIHEPWDPLDQVKGLKELLDAPSNDKGASEGAG